MKDFIIKLLISIAILAFVFVFMEKKPPTNAINFEIKKKDNTPAVPSQLKWHDPFKGMENVPSK